MAAQDAGPVREEADPVAVARATIEAERARISRELHDIVAHSVTVMVLQAGGAKRVLGRDPDRAMAALSQIEKTGAQAMQELDRMLRVLRCAADDEPVGSGCPGRPGLADIGELVEEARGAGVPTDLVEDGDPAPVDPSVSLAAYRVVQEALTNVARHGGEGAVAGVRLCWTDTLLVEVVNGPGGSLPTAALHGLSTGHGLIGLRERVTVAGGHLVAEPAPGGGFRVGAVLPLCGGARGGSPAFTGGRGEDPP